MAIKLNQQKQNLKYEGRHSPILNMQLKKRAKRGTSSTVRPQ